MKFASFREIIDLWPTRGEVGADVFRFRRNKRRRRPNVRVWFARDSIPTWWFDAVVEAAQHRGFPDVTYPLLVTLWRARHPQPKEN